jgi:chloride channel 2
MAAVRRGQQQAARDDGGLAGELGKLLPPSKGRSDGAHEFQSEGGRKSRKDNPNILLHFTFLVLLGAMTAVLALLIELTILALGSVRHSVTFYFDNAVVSCMLWAIWGTLVAVAATGVPKHIDDNAVGSGLPQMKSILSGFVINRYMSLRTLVAKAIGLCFAHGAGLCIGKEGPMVHLGACVANCLCSHLSIFRPFKNDQQMYFNLLGAAVAVGVVATFGAPVGGVLFSIEVTATYYMVSNLPFALIAAVSGCLTFKAFHQLDGEEDVVVDLFEPTQFQQIELDETIFAYALLGIMSGFVGGSFLLFVKKVATFRRTDPRLKGRRYLNCAATGLLTAMLTFQFDILRCGTSDIINALFSHQQFDWQACGGPHRFGGSVFLNLLLFLVYKIVFTAISITLPIPAGVFGPVFIIGAALGRFTGETFGMIFPALAAKHTAGAFAVVGAAAVSGAVTRTVSTAVIVFELTTQLSHMLPVLVAVLLAYAVANLMSPSIYEVMMILNGLPYMPHLASRHDIVNVRATDVLQECDDYLIYKVSTYRDAARILRNTDLPGYVSIPIVKSSNQLVLVGTVQRGSLQKSVEGFLKTTVDWEQFGHDSDEAAAASPTALLRSGLAAIKKKGGAPRRNYSRVEGDGTSMTNGADSEGDSNDVPSGGGGGGGGSGGGGNGSSADASARERVEDALDTVLHYRDMDSDVVKSSTAIMVDTAPFTLLDTVMFSRGMYQYHSIP